MNINIENTYFSFFSLAALPDAFNIVFLIDTSTTAENDEEKMSTISKQIFEKIHNISRLLNLNSSNKDITLKATKYGNKAQMVPQYTLLPEGVADTRIMGGPPSVVRALRTAQTQFDAGVPTLLVILQTNTIPSDQIEPLKTLLSQYKKQNSDLYVLAIGSESTNDETVSDDRLNLKKLLPAVDDAQYLGTSDATEEGSLDQLLPLISKPLNSFRGKNKSTRTLITNNHYACSIRILKMKLNKVLHIKILCLS